jgi:DNA-binding transcriptional LysR family regulator
MVCVIASQSVCLQATCCIFAGRIIQPEGVLAIYNWDDLKVFIEISKTLNLSKAAKQLEIDQTTVYRRIMRFERKTGRKLLKKTGQGYVLTVWGEALARKSMGLEDEIKKIDMLLEDNLSDIFGSVNITTTNVIANVVLPPMLFKFHKKYPQLKLEITVAEEFFDMYKREADIAIRSSEIIEPHEHAVKVGKGTWAMYATKKYLKGKPKINSPKFYSDNYFILGSEKIAHIKSTKWLRTKIDEENISLKASSMESIYSGVRAGLGIALLPSVYKTMDPSLIELSKPDPKFSSPIWLITQKELVESEKIKICLDYFHKELKSIFRY